MPGRRSSSRWFALAAAWLVCMLLGTATAAAQTNSQTVADSPRLDISDTELIESLERIGLLEDWVSTAPVSRQAALLSVSAGSDYTEARRALLEGSEALIERHDLIENRAERLNQVDAQADVLEEVIRTLRREVTSQGRTAAVSLTNGRVRQARLTTAFVGSFYGRRGFSLDSTSLAEHQLASVRDQLSRAVDELVRRSSPLRKSGDAVVSRLNVIQAELGQVAELVQTARDRDAAGQFELMAARAELVALMPNLHQQRMLGTTEITGMTLVTIDAYVQAASALDSSCPVDWTMLAGIGRVESRHGTIDDGAVRSSGQVTSSIYGPLLDGGATEREAEEAAALAEEEAILAELEALAIAEAEAAYDPAVWGEETLLRAEEIALDAEGNAEPVGLAAAAAASQEESDAEDSEDDEEEEPRGNGFAVIEDSDGGELDGSDRWDRAVGPMQFIPETWSYWKTDGNGDGVTDPQNLYDAAASAGRMLCSLSRTRGPSPSKFILGYNSSDTYVRNVLSFADIYGSLPLPE